LEEGEEREREERRGVKTFEKNADSLTTKKKKT